MEPQTPRQRRYDKNRQGILDAASALIIEQGVQALSIRTLAEKVDYSPSALYKYFDNKEEIIAALRQQAWELSAAMQQRRIQPGMDTLEMLYQMGMGYLDFAQAYPAHYLLTMSPSEAIPENMAAFIADPRFGGLINFVDATVKAGNLRLPDGYGAVHMAFLMWFIAHGASMLKLTLMKKCEPEFNQIAGEVMRMMIDLFKKI